MTHFDYWRIGKLDPLNEVDIYCLHYVFKPLINAALVAFVESWNNHTISTVSNLTPNQLFIQGAIEYNRYPHPPRPVSCQQSLSTPVQRNTIVVPRIHFVPCTYLRQLLTVGIDPLESSDDFGCSLYARVCNIVGCHLQMGCINCIE